MIAIIGDLQSAELSIPDRRGKSLIKETEIRDWSGG